MKENEYIGIDNNLTINNIKEIMLQDYSIVCDYCDMQIDNKRYVKPAMQIK